MVSNCIQPESGSTLTLFFGFFFLSRFSVVSLDKVAAFLGLVREFPGVLPRVSDPQLFEKDATMCDEPKQV